MVGLDVEVKEREGSRRALESAGLGGWEVECLLWRDHCRGGTGLWVRWGTTGSSIWSMYRLRCLHLVRNWLCELSFALKLIRIVSHQNGTTLGLLIMYVKCVRK